MTERRKNMKRREKTDRPDFFIKLAVCAALFALVWSAGKLRPEVAETVARTIDTGLDGRQVIELLGEGVSSRDALEKLWQSGVVEVWNEIFP